MTNFSAPHTAADSSSDQPCIGLWWADSCDLELLTVHESIHRFVDTRRWLMQTAVALKDNGYVTHPAESPIVLVVCDPDAFARQHAEAERSGVLEEAMNRPGLRARGNRRARFVHVPGNDVPSVRPAAPVVSGEPTWQPCVLLWTAWEQALKPLRLDEWVEECWFHPQRRVASISALHHYGVLEAHSPHLLTLLRDGAEFERQARELYPAALPRLDEQAPDTRDSAPGW